MAHFNDIKYQALQIALGSPKRHIDDEDQLFIRAIVANEGLPADPQQINDLWYRFFVHKGFSGQFNDAAYAYFVSLGIPPTHINEMWRIFWAAIGIYFDIPALPYEFELAATIEPYEFDGGIGDYELQMPVEI